MTSSHTQKLQQEIDFIKKTMEASTTYRNLPPMAYIAAGILGAIGVGLTYLLLGSDRAADLNGMSIGQATVFLAIWLVVLTLSLISTIHFLISNAKKRGLPFWNSLANRMFVSQLPLFLFAGALTLGLAGYAFYGMIPAVWLGCFGVILFSFSYFTDRLHRTQGILFLLLGTAAALGPAGLSMILMGIGFGAVLFVFGIVRLFYRD